MLKVELRNGEFVGVWSDKMVKQFQKNKVKADDWFVQMKTQDGKSFLQSLSICEKEDGVHSVCARIYENGHIRVYLNTPQESKIIYNSKLKPLNEINGTLIHSGKDIDNRHVYFRKMKDPNPVCLRKDTFPVNVKCFKKKFKEGGREVQKYLTERFSIGIRWQRVPKVPLNVEYTVEEGNNIRIDVYENKTGDLVGTGSMEYRLI